MLSSFFSHKLLSCGYDGVQQYYRKVSNGGDALCTVTARPPIICTCMYRTLINEYNTNNY